MAAYKTKVLDATGQAIREIEKAIRDCVRSDILTHQEGDVLIEILHAQLRALAKTLTETINIHEVQNNAIRNLKTCLSNAQQHIEYITRNPVADADNAGTATGRE